MTGMGVGHDGMGDGNGGTQRRKDAMKSRRGIPAYPLPSFPRRRESSASWRLTTSRGRG